MIAALVLLTVTGWEVHGRLRSQALLDNLLRAPTEDVPAVVADMASYRRWLDEPLRQAYADAEANHDARKQLHASLALLPVDAGQVEYLYGRLLTAEPHEVLVLRDALRPHAETVSERLWALLEDAEQCLQASVCGRPVPWRCLRRRRRPLGRRSATMSATALLAENALVIGPVGRGLKPVGRHLLPPLAGRLLEEGPAR